MQISLPDTSPAAEATAKEQNSDSDDYGASDDSDSGDDINFEVFVQEMHDSYSSYGRGKLLLASL